MPSTKKPVVDKTKCIGCGTCEAICPRVFHLAEDGRSSVRAADYVAARDDIDAAIAACPSGAIRWEE